MKKYLTLACLLGLSAAAQAQLTTGAGGLTIKAGTAFSCMGLVLTPAADLTLQQDTIRLSATPVAFPGGASIARVYTVSPSLAFSGTMGIRYAAAELNGNQESTLSLAYAGPTGNFSTLTSATGVTGSYYVYSAGPVSTVLGRITAVNTGVPLPVSYQNFAAKAGPSCSVILSWNADQAQPGDFHIERSQDGRSFSEVKGSVSRSGNQFSLTDAEPIQGRNIYRLAISEADKPSLYSTTVVADNPCSLPARIAVYPNPARTSLSLALDHTPTEAAVAGLFDKTGRLIKTFRINGQVSRLDISDIAAGTYFLKIQSGSAEEQIQVVKQ